VGRREASASSPKKELISRAVPGVVAVASKAASSPGLECVLAVLKGAFVSCDAFVLRVLQLHPVNQNTLSFLKCDV
jgi:hypothetical protein